MQIEEGAALEDKAQDVVSVGGASSYLESVLPSFVRGPFIRDTEDEEEGTLRCQLVPPRHTTMQIDRRMETGLLGRTEG